MRRGWGGIGGVGMPIGGIPRPLTLSVKLSEGVNRIALVMLDV